MLVEDIDAGIGGWNSNWHRESVIFIYVVAVNHATDGGLGGAILVVNLHGPAELLSDVACQLGLEILSAHDKLANSGGAQVHVFDHGQVRWGELHDIHCPVLEDFPDRHAVHSRILAVDHDATTGNKRRKGRGDR